MNLEELNLVELNVQETLEIEGGILPAILAAVEIAGACYAAGYAVGYFMSH
ncbi:class IIb bacteriocin, lactobin A/cerein 7B family [Flavobacterium sp. KACC 22758]|jgi:lactobin A/cerein 7B family class IIb bacteriocin|uniref:class IIb bacteriocin, lactobin A/cerein 7B family n=1 Tax=Flavobacterium sp. KACC 22758 TaxID=3025667 RepID=UPI000EB4F6EE|nr:class IIb bacteriocin, lactobin A/cerein 7B family [Flavobacterium sp. KACC 22758]WDF59902.1 class IIb bacteriocin, lactobin A/cerein 7B family [Flavobacterium sp. KACC 22758]